MKTSNLHIPMQKLSQTRKHEQSLERTPHPYHPTAAQTSGRQISHPNSWVLGRIMLPKDGWPQTAQHTNGAK